MTPSDKSYSVLAWEIAQRASFGPAIGGEGVRAEVRLRAADGVIGMRVIGVGATHDSALHDLALELDALNERAGRVEH